jgi:hypothetical protein
MMMRVGFGNNFVYRLKEGLILYWKQSKGEIINILLYFIISTPRNSESQRKFNKIYGILIFMPFLKQWKQKYDQGNILQK